jgi:hypothetical protein
MVQRFGAHIPGHQIKIIKISNYENLIVSRITAVKEKEVKVDYLIRLRPSAVRPDMPTPMWSSILNNFF